MPLFTYKAVNEKKKIIEDTIFASDADDAAQQLKSDGWIVLTIKNIDKQSKGVLSGSISASEKAMLCRFLATMMRAGLPLPEAIDIIKQETKNLKLQKILADVSFQVRKGRNISAILSQYKDDFDPIFITIVKAGEDAGTLETSFDYLAKQLTASHELTQRVRGSLMYPAVIIVAMVVVGFVMLLFVLPRVSSAFKNLNIPIPAVTRALFSFGGFIGSNMSLVIGVGLLILLLHVFIIVFRPTRALIVRILVKIPLIKNIAGQLDVARFARTLSTLLRSGVSVVDALNVAAESLSQAALRSHAKKFSSGVSKGASLSDVLSKAKGAFPVTLIQTIKAGERTGTLDEVLLEMAEFYEKEVDFALKRFTSLLEPLLMLFVGIAVGAMVIVIIAPIYGVVGGLQESLAR